MKLPIRTLYIYFDEDNPRAYLGVEYKHPDTIMESIPIENRKQYLIGLTIVIPELNPKKLITILLLLHELGHIHYKTYLVSNKQINPDVFMKHEYLSSAYALRSIKVKYHKEAVEFLASGPLNYSKQFKHRGKSISEKALSLEYHKEQILKLYKEGL